MNRDDIIRMAREAGMVVYEGEQDRVLFDGSIVDALIRFANLVMLGQYEQGFEDGFADGADAEREACAKVVEQAGADGYGTLAAALLVRERGAP